MTGRRGDAPEGISATEFWGVLLGDISRHLLADVGREPRS